MKQLPFAIVLGSSLLVAQGESKSVVPPSVPVILPKDAPPQEVPPAVTPWRDLVDLRGSAARKGRPDAQAPVPGALTEVVVDTAADGTILAAAEEWKASFTPAGATFVPFLGSQAPRNLPVRFHLAAATVAGEPLPIEASAPSLRAGVVAIEHGSLREEYALGLSGIEQSFVFERLPTRGELRLVVAADGEFTVRAGADGHRFEHALGSFGYGRAVAIDAAGRHCDLATEWDGGAFTITVPAAFAAQAKLPLVVDPVIGSVVAQSSASRIVRATDLAYDSSLDLYGVCWERVYSATDSDVYFGRFGGSMGTTGGALAIDISNNSWRNCHIANLELGDRFLVVAEVSVGNVAPSWVAGRTYDAGVLLMGVPFDIEHGTFATTNPVVGGDGNLAGPTYFTVVFEREWTATDHDILMRQVDQAGALRGTTFTLLDNSTAFEHSPAISKTCGWNESGTQNWLIAYRRDNATQGQTRGSLVHWNGGLVQVNGANNFAVTGFAAPTGPQRLAVSSPTLANLGRYHLVVDATRDAPTQHSVLRGSVVSSFGNVVISAQQLTAGGADNYGPAADCDGARFVFDYTHVYSASPLDLDVQVMLADIDGNHLALNDVAAAADTTDLEHDVAVAARRTHAGFEYGLAWSHDVLAAVSQVEGVGYRGIAGNGGIHVRSTGCGPLSLNVAGYGALGEAVGFQLTNTQGLCGWLVGFPVSAPLGGCPGCTVGSTADALIALGSFNLQVPTNAAFVGLTFAFQGFDFAAGTCFGNLAFGDTVDLTIR